MHSKSMNLVSTHADRSKRNGDRKDCPWMPDGEITFHASFVDCLECLAL